MTLSIFNKNGIRREKREVASIKEAKQIRHSYLRLGYPCPKLFDANGQEIKDFAIC